MSYNIGDVIRVYFPYKKEDGTVEIKERHAIVYKIHQDKSSALIQLTSKNKSSKYSGFWITKDSSEGRQMGLTRDSFIHLNETYWVPNKFIRRLVGTCCIMEKINRAMEALKIKPKRQIV